MESLCPVCSKEKKPTNKYCSYACRNIVINSNKDYSKQNQKLSETNLRKTAAKRSHRVSNCETCSQPVTQQSDTSGKFPDKCFCSRSCANTRAHSDDTKAKTRATLQAAFVSSGGTLKDYKCEVCGNLTETIKKFCSSDCRKQNSFKRAQQLLLSRSDFALYRRLTKFEFGIPSYPKYFDASLIEQHGWYKAKNHGDNPNGVSRDHIISVVWGYKNDVNPYLLSHPANCQLMVQRKNVSKGCRESIVVDDLMS